MIDKEILEKSADLLRKELCSIDLASIEELKKIKLTDAEQLEVAGTAEVFFNSIFDKVITLLVQKQLEEIGLRALNEGQMVFGRGTINGLALIKEWFGDQINISQARFNKPEKPELGEVIG